MGWGIRKLEKKSWEGVGWLCWELRASQLCGPATMGSSRRVWGFL